MSPRRRASAKSASLYREPAAPRLGSELPPLDVERIEDDVTWERARIHDAVFAAEPGAQLWVNACRLDSVRLVGVRLDRFQVHDSALTACDLSGARFEKAELHRVEIVRCRLSGTIFEGAQMSDVRIVDSKLDGVWLREASLARVHVEDCVASDADLQQVSATSSALVRCDLRNADFTKAALSQVRLHGSDLSTVRGALSLRGATIDAMQAIVLGARLLEELAITVED